MNIVILQTIMETLFTLEESSFWEVKLRTPALFTEVNVQEDPAYTVNEVQEYLSHIRQLRNDVVHSGESVDDISRDDFEDLIVNISVYISLSVILILHYFAEEERNYESFLKSLELKGTLLKHGEHNPEKAYFDMTEEVLLENDLEDAQPED